MSSTPYPEDDWRQSFQDWLEGVSLDKQRVDWSNEVVQMPELVRIIAKCMPSREMLQHTLKQEILHHISTMKRLHRGINSAWAYRLKRQKQWGWGWDFDKMREEVDQCLALGYPVDTYPDVRDDMIDDYARTVGRFRDSVRDIIATMKLNGCFCARYVHNLFVDVIPAFHWRYVAPVCTTDAQITAQINVGIVFAIDIVASELGGYVPVVPHGISISHLALDACTLYCMLTFLADNQRANRAIDVFRSEIVGPWNAGFDKRWWTVPVDSQATGIRLGTSMSWCEAIVAQKNARTAPSYI